ncbi:MAG: DMT family transporter [Hyphomicrobiaceae bacterium]
MPPALASLAHRLYEAPSLLLTLAALSWAGNAVASRLAIDHISPFTLVSVRWILVIAVLWPLFGAEVRRHWPQIRQRRGWVVLMAIIGFTLFNVLMYIAARSTSAINIGIIQGAMPVLVLLGALLAYGTRVTLVQMIGVLVTLLGVAVVATKGMPWAILEVGLAIGDALMLAACAFYAFYTVGLRTRPQMDGAAFFTLLALIACVTSAPLVLYELATTTFTPPTVQGWLVAVYVAIFPSCLAQLFFMRGVDLIGPGRAGVYINLVPVFSAILAVLILAEPFALFHGIALALVIGGIWLAQRTA